MKKFLDLQKSKNHPVVVLPSGEENKTLDSVLSIVKAALEADFNRNSVFVGIGGGVITDMTAFAASIFKRGAKLELIPTSLLAMVDAACGGKTGCDFENYKRIEPYKFLRCQRYSCFGRNVLGYTHDSH